MTEKAETGLKNAFYAIIGGLVVTVASIALQSSKVDKSDFSIELNKKVDEKVYEQHLKNEDAKFELLLQEIRENRAEIKKMGK